MLNDKKTFFVGGSREVSQYTPSQLNWFDHQCVKLKALEQIGRPSVSQMELEKNENACLCCAANHTTQHGKWIFGCML